MEVDKDGFLINLDDWNEEVARQLAAADAVQLTDQHWEVIYALRDFYSKTEVAPAMRPFVKLIKTQLGVDQGNSIYLMSLFGSSPAKTAAKWAGLPRPTHCL
jgi:tRNA 2-thiouridine synthesizing protein E